MKKSKVLLPFLSLACLLGGALAFSSSVSGASAATSTTSYTNKVAYWKVLSGVNVGKTNTSTGVNITNLYNPYPQVAFQNAVNLDGFEFDFSRKEDLALNGNSLFFFTNNISKAHEGTWGNGGPVFSFWKEVYSSQTRLSVAADHNHNSNSLCYYNKTDRGFGVTGIAASKQTLVLVPPKATSNFEGLHFKFEKGTGSNAGWWVISIKEITAGYVSTAKPCKNYVVGGDGLATVTNYIKNEDMEKALIGDTTYSYLCLGVCGPNDSTKAKSVYAENLKYNPSIEEGYADDYFNTMTCDPTGASEPVIDTTLWQTLVSNYNSEVPGIQNSLKAHVLEYKGEDYSGDKMKEFAARYQILAKRSAEYDFMNIRGQLSASNNGLLQNGAVSLSLIISGLIIVVICVSYFAYSKKRKNVR